MRIQFFKEADSEYAISEKEVYKKQVCDELWWAEIDKAPQGVVVRWEDDYSNPVPMRNFSEARSYILQNYHLHTPQIVGERFQL
jgi:hypothetical protein